MNSKVNKTPRRGGRGETAEKTTDNTVPPRSCRIMSLKRYISIKAGFAGNTTVHFLSCGAGA